MAKKTKSLSEEKYWIQTYTCNKFHYNKPDTSRINIVDIAHALSHTTRFSGHLNFPLSIAQHSLHVAAVIEKEKQSKELALLGLMHDAHEAYTGDITSPMKIMLKELHGFDWVDKIERPIRTAINLRFGLNYDKVADSIIKHYDLVMLRSEAEDLFDKVVDDWTKQVSTSRTTHAMKTILNPMQSKKVFIETYKRLGGTL